MTECQERERHLPRASQTGRLHILAHLCTRASRSLLATYDWVLFRFSLFPLQALVQLKMDSSSHDSAVRLLTGNAYSHHVLRSPAPIRIVAKSSFLALADLHDLHCTMWRVSKEKDCDTYDQSIAKFIVSHMLKK